MTPPDLLFWGMIGIAAVSLFVLVIATAGLNLTFAIPIIAAVSLFVLVIAWCAEDI